jgi:hypothetical protein
MSKVPSKHAPGLLIRLAQVGNSGLKKVQYWVHPVGQPLSDNDPYLTGGIWRDAIILPPPVNWGSDLPNGKLPSALQIDDKTGNPFSWPISNTVVHWAALEKINDPGEYELRCRTIDANDIAQPLPRPFGRSGINIIELARLIVEV